MIFNRLHLSFLFVLAISLPLLAQQNALEQFTQEVIQHKVRTNAADYIEFHQAHPDALRQYLESNGEVMPAVAGRHEDASLNETPEPESELHAAVNPVDTNNIIICAMRNTPDNILAPLTFPIYYTKDFGASWEVSEFNGVSEGQFMLGGGDPIIVFDTDGTAYLCWLTLDINILEFDEGIRLRFAKSTDGGATWVPIDEFVDSGKLLDVIQGDFGKFVDKEWLAVDHSDSPYRNTIYISYLTLETFGDSLAANITLRKKTPEMERFTDTSVVVNTEKYKLVQFTSIDVDSRGVVHVSFAGTLDSLNWSMYYTQSGDGGETFKPEVNVSDFHIPRLSADEPESTIVGIDTARIYPCPHMVVDNSGGTHEGNLYMVWTANGQDSKKTEGLDIYYSRSTDGGQNWSDVQILNDDGLPESHQFYPSITVNEKGIVVVTWYDRREDPANVQTHFYMTYSEDGGETFVENFPVSTQAADFSRIGDLNGAFGIGEYTQTVATPNFAIPVWSDGRTNDGNIDLFIAFVPIGAESTVTSVSTISTNFSLSGPFPNPMQKSGQVQLNLKKASDVQVRVFDVQGKRIRTLVDSKKLASGTHQFEVSDLPHGQYFLHVNTDFGYRTLKFVVQR